MMRLQPREIQENYGSVYNALNGWLPDLSWQNSIYAAFDVALCGVNNLLKINQLVSDRVPLLTKDG